MNARSFAALTFTLFVATPAMGQTPASQPASQPASHPASHISHYTCPMHSSVKETHPGKCPICGMPLTPVYANDAAKGVVVVDAVRRQKIGVKIAAVERRPMTRTIRAYGRVAYDESRLYDVAPRVHGWVVELNARVSGQYVARGRVLCRLYSPDVYAAELQLVEVLKRGADSKTLATFERKLALLGVDERDVAELKKTRVPHEAIAIRAPVSGFVIDKNVVEGTHAAAGARLFRVAAMDRVWFEADVYETDATLVKVGQTASIQLAHVPGHEATGEIQQVLPYLDERDRSVRVRVAVDNPDGVYKTGMYADVRIAVPLGEVLQVPEDAVIYTGNTRLVFVDVGEDRLLPKVVEIGRRSDGYVEIRSGLEEHDRIVVSGNFLIAAESRIQSAAKYWGTSNE